MFTRCIILGVGLLLVFNSCKQNTRQSTRSLNRGTNSHRDSIVVEGSSKSSPAISVNKGVTGMYDQYVDAWSKGNFETIAEQIYDIPFSLFLQDSTIVFNSVESVRSYLAHTFKELERNDYGYSVINHWEHYKEDDRLVVVEMNFTRFLKDSTIMGPKERSVTYILRKYQGKYRISGMAPHTPIAM